MPILQSRTLLWSWWQSWSRWHWRRPVLEHFQIYRRNLRSFSARWTAPAAANQTAMNLEASCTMRMVLGRSISPIYWRMSGVFMMRMARRNRNPKQTVIMRKRETELSLEELPIQFRFQIESDKWRWDREHVDKSSRGLNQNRRLCWEAVN